MKDQLFILAAPFADGGFEWYCNDCATLEGALLVNPHWIDKVDVHRIGFTRPRQQIIDLVGPDWQGCPMLVMAKARAPGDAIIVCEFAILQVVRAIGRALMRRPGGVGPHP